MAKSKKALKIIIPIAAVVLIGAIVFANLKNRKQGVKVQTEKVKVGRLVSTVSGSAKLQPEVEVKISAKVSGQILDLGVREGEIVEKGQFLVQLDQELYKAQVDQAKSGLDFAKAGYDKAINSYKRDQKLYADNLISDAELEISKANYEQAKSTVAQQEANLIQAKDNLSKTTIYSPMTGVVTRLSKKLGEMAMGSQFTLDVIMVVADLTVMRAETEIDENDVIHVAFQDTATIHVDAFPDTTFKGLVTEIANSGTTLGAGTQEEITNFLVKVTMIEKPESIRPGMSATVDIITESIENALKIPIQCVTSRKPIEEKPEAKSDENKTEKDRVAETDSTEDDKPQIEDKKAVKVVFVVDNGVAKQVEVSMGISSDTEWEVKSGLEEGQEIVSGPYRILSKQMKDGLDVSVDNSIPKNKDKNK